MSSIKSTKVSPVKLYFINTGTEVHIKTNADSVNNTHSSECSRENGKGGGNTRY